MRRDQRTTARWVGVGHVAGTLKKAAALMGLGFVKVC
jgi:hypothetical protein